MFAVIKKRFKAIKNSRGVVSLEACIVLPIFILLLLFLYGFIIMFLGQNTMAHSLIQSAESLSLDTFASERIASDVGGLSEENSEQLITAFYGELFTEQNEYFSSSEKWHEAGNEAVAEVAKKRFIAFLVGSSSNNNIRDEADEMLKFLRIQGGVDGLDFSDSKVENGVLTINVKYKQEFIFDFNGLAAFEREQTLSINLWSES